MDLNKTEPTLHILLVEDNKHDRIAFNRVFRESGIPYDITECGRAEEALELLEAGESSFNIVVIDHGLPGMSGMEL